MNRKIIMIYDLKGRDSERIRFNRRLFQYKVQSHKGRYKSTSKGILKKYKKPIRSVVVFNKKDLTKVKKLVQEFNVDHKLYEINKEIK